MGEDDNKTRQFSGRPSPSAPPHCRNAQPTGLGRQPTSPRLAPDFLIPPPWQRERARRLHRICSSIEQRVEHGQGLLRAVRRFARYYAGRHYRSERQRALQFSAQTILRCYYLWRSKGRTAEALVLKHYGGKQKLNSQHTAELVKVCLDPGVLSVRSAYRKLISPAGCHTAYRERLGAKVRKKLRELFHARHTALAVEKAAAKWRQTL
jgi:hypothetical protein